MRLSWKRQTLSPISLLGIESHSPPILLADQNRVFWIILYINFYGPEKTQRGWPRWGENTKPNHRETREGTWNVYPEVGKTWVGDHNFCLQAIDRFPYNLSYAALKGMTRSGDWKTLRFHLNMDENFLLITMVPRWNKLSWEIMNALYRGRSSRGRIIPIKDDKRARIESLMGTSSYKSTPVIPGEPPSPILRPMCQVDLSVYLVSGVGAFPRPGQSTVHPSVTGAESGVLTWPTLCQSESIRPNSGKRELSLSTELETDRM